MARRGGGGLAFALAAVMLPGAVVAEVVAQAREGFVVAHSRVLGAPPARAYEVLTDDIGAWWNPDHTYSGDAANLVLEARAGGCLCERLAGGGSVEHMRVLVASPGALLRLAGGLGPLQSMGANGTMDFTLAAEGEGTRLEFRYTVGGYVPDGLAAVAEPVDRVLGDQLARLAAYIDSGSGAGNAMWERSPDRGLPEHLVAIGRSLPQGGGGL